MFNNSKSRCECRKHHICEKDDIWSSATYSCKSGKYLASIIDDSVMTCGEIKDEKTKSNNKETKTIPKNIICETKSIYILLAFLLIAIALLIAVSIFFYLRKYKAKQKHLLPFYGTNNKSK